MLSLSSNQSVDSARLGAGSVRSGMRRSREMIPASTAASTAGAGSVMAAFERKEEERKKEKGGKEKVTEERGEKDTKEKNNQWLLEGALALALEERSSERSAQNRPSS